MASSLIANALQVNFDSVLTFPEEGMVKMFKALESTGLCGFLGCPSVLYEQDLEKFFSVAFVKENEVISAVQGKFVGISQEQFSGAFGLPIAGLTDMFEVPKDLVYDSSSIFSASSEPVKTSCKKREMKFEFRLLNNILEKSVTAKAGSFDAVTHERFLLMKAIHFGLKINWSKILFDIFKDMHADQSTFLDSSSDSIVSIRVSSPDAIPNFSSSSSTSFRYENLNSSRSSSSSDSQMLFNADDLPEISPTDDVVPVEETPGTYISLPTAGVLSTAYTKEVAQLRATVDQISIEHVKTRLHLDELKAVLFKKISSLQTAFLTASDNQDRVVLSQTNVLHKDMQAHKDAMSKELDAMRKEVQDQKAAITKDLLEFHVEAQENFHTLSAHLAELIAYINRDRDDKKGEASSSRVPQPPDDRSGRGRGSRSEPPRKRGGSTSSRGFRYWLGGI
ncbi:hypothetical protein F511_11152 [Dorcoceras hygrometricum]|nr:hypothetical protein F511_11152 [Dorcoceras hygrometricum]